MKYALHSIWGGSDLIPLLKHVDQEKINTFGVITGSTGPVHTDPEFCKTQSFQTTLAHGYLLFGYACEMMENNFGIDWNRSGNIEVKFIGAAKPGDSLLITGAIIQKTKQDNGELVRCQINIVNHNNTKILIGESTILLTQ